MIKNFINIGKKGKTLGLILLAAAGISAGCSTKAESRPASEPTIAKNNAAPTPSPTPVIKATPAPDPDQRRFDGDFEGDMEYSTPLPAKKTAVKLSQATFEKIKVGMTLGEVEKIVGDQGMLIGTNIINGKTKYIYKWANDDFSSYIDVMIENGKVAGKNNKNLK